MRLLIQRVSQAQVRVAGEAVGQIGPGMLLFLGIHKEDGKEQVHKLAEKVTGLRIFEDEAGKMNRSLGETGGQILVVSQFTLYGSCNKGRRPEFTSAAAPEMAQELYDLFVAQLPGKVETGRFGAKMEVSLVNDGPVTLLLEV